MNDPSTTTPSSVPSSLGILLDTCYQLENINGRTISVHTDCKAYKRPPEVQGPNL